MSKYATWVNVVKALEKNAEAFSPGERLARDAASLAILSGVTHDLSRLYQGRSTARLPLALQIGGIGVLAGTGLKRSLRQRRKEKTAMAFTKQDRPEKVKEIYRALKRDHPSMPAEMKARIAARQGKRGKQKQGPPYKGPLRSEYTPDMRERDMHKNASIWKKLRGLFGKRTEVAGEEALDALRAARKKARYGSAEQYGKPGSPAAPAVQLERMKMEKGAMPSRSAILKALAGVGAVGTAGAGGYAVGHRTGMKRDAETPYGTQHMRFAYSKGQQDLAQRLRAAVAARQATAEKTKKAADRSLFDTPKRPGLLASSKERKQHQKEVDKFRSEIGSTGRTKANLAATGVGAGMGALLAGKGLKRRATAAGGLGVATGAMNALLLDLSRRRHERRGKEKKASVSELTAHAFQDELTAIFSG